MTENGGHPEHKNILDETFSWLKNPNLLENLVHDLGRCGIVGEPGNVVTLILVHNSRLCEPPLNLSPSGESGIGKSFLVCQVSDFWERCTAVTGYMSKTALVHDTDWAKKGEESGYVVDLAGKILIILEAESSRDFLDLMKPIRSHDRKEISFKITEREGKLAVKKVVTRGWPVFITLSVNPSEKSEDSTRDLNLTPAYSEAKGRAVNLQRGKKKGEPWKFLTDNELVELRSNWTHALSLLRPYKVINPFATRLAESYDTKNPRSMRDFEKICSLFESSAILHQFQRIIVETGNGETYVIGTFDDLRITLKIANILLESTTSGLRSDVLKAHREFFARVCPPGHGKTRQELMDEWYRHYGTTVKRSTFLENYLYPLGNAGLMNKDDTERTHRWEVSSVELSGPVETNPTLLLKDYSYETGLRSQLYDLFSSVGVSTIMRGESPISTASTESVIQEILASVQSSTVRQFFIDKLSDPLSSCLKDEDKVSAGTPPTHLDTSDKPATLSDRGGFADRITKACEMFEGGREVEEIELTVGSEVLGHCYRRGLIPKLGGRP